MIFCFNKANGKWIWASRCLVASYSDRHTPLGIKQYLACSFLKVHFALLAATDIINVLLFLNFAIGVNKPELLYHLLLQIIARQLDRISANKGLARAKGTGVVRREVCICRGDLHALERNA